MVASIPFDEPEEAEPAEGSLGAKVPASDLTSEVAPATDDASIAAAPEEEEDEASVSGADPEGEQTTPGAVAPEDVPSQGMPSSSSPPPAKDEPSSSPEVVPTTRPVPIMTDPVGHDVPGPGGYGGPSGHSSEGLGSSGGYGSYDFYAGTGPITGSGDSHTWGNTGSTSAPSSGAGSYVPSPSAASPSAQTPTSAGTTSASAPSPSVPPAKPPSPAKVPVQTLLPEIGASGVPVMYDTSNTKASSSLTANQARAEVDTRSSAAGFGVPVGLFLVSVLAAFVM